MVQRTVFDKKCKCGNVMQIVIRKDNDSVIVECAESPSGEYTCYMVANTIVLCGACKRRYRFNYHAEAILARLWDMPTETKGVQ